ncbi:hypothetical protein CW752_01735 [Chryseobacterium sp. PMSZPI]|nr:hypothetical protein CW752_01735 [Chryseobacterium sp. PMSZPI]
MFFNHHNKELESNRKSFLSAKIQVKSLEVKKNQLYPLYLRAKKYTHKHFCKLVYSVGKDLTTKAQKFQNT